MRSQLHAQFLHSRIEACSFHAQNLCRPFLAADLATGLLDIESSSRVTLQELMQIAADIHVCLRTTQIHESQQFLLGILPFRAAVLKEFLRPGQQLLLPVLDLVGVDVELLGQIRQGTIESAKELRISFDVQFLI